MYTYTAIYISSVMHTDCPLNVVIKSHHMGPALKFPYDIDIECFIIYFFLPLINSITL